MKQITNNRYVVLLFLLFVYLLFQNRVIKYFDSFLVGPLFSTVVINGWVYILVALFSIVSVLIVLVKIQQRKLVDNWLALISIVILLTYLYYRFFTNRYIYFRYDGAKEVVLTDTVVVLLGGIIFMKIVEFIDINKQPHYYSTPFLLDKPIENSSNDILHRKEFAKRIAEKIQSRPQILNSGSLAIGITGEWGAGKTSFVNLIKEYIDYNNRIVFDYNPWSNNENTNVINPFFSLLISKLSEYDSGLSNSMKKYAKAIAEVDENIITKMINVVYDWAVDNDRLETLEHINKSLSRVGKQIIVFVDDIDRLNTTEIVEVFKLIRNTANFNNVVYVVTYDKEYIASAIEEYNAHNNEVFLNKIFQFDFLLPNTDSRIVREKITDTLLNVLGKEYSTEINDAVNYLDASGTNITSMVLKSQRDVVRFCNALLFDVKDVLKEINFIDFYLIQLIKFKHYKYYKFLSDYYDTIFVTDNDQVRLRKLSEKGLSDQQIEMQASINRADSNPTSEESTYMYEVLKGHFNEDAVQRDIYILIIDELLKAKYFNKVSKTIDYRCFSSLGNIHKYFTIQLLESDLPADEFEIKRKGAYSIYKNKVLSWIRVGRLNDIYKRLDKINSFNNTIEYENHLKILFDIARYAIDNDINSIPQIEKLILSVIQYPASRGKKTLVYDSDKKYVEFIDYLFRYARKPYVLESNLLDGFRIYNIDTIFTKEEIEELLIQCLQLHCKVKYQINMRLFRLYYNCYTWESRGMQVKTYFTKATSILRKYFHDNLFNDNLPIFITEQFDEGSYFISNSFIKVLYEGNWIEFKKHIYNSKFLLKSDLAYVEFLNFLHKFERNNYNAVSFDFKYLKIGVWQSQL